LKGRRTKKTTGMGTRGAKELGGQGKAWSERWKKDGRGSKTSPSGAPVIRTGGGEGTESRVNEKGSGGRKTFGNADRNSDAAKS